MGELEFEKQHYVNRKQVEFRPVVHRVHISLHSGTLSFYSAHRGIHAQRILTAGMAPRIDDVMRLCCDLSANHQIKVAVKNSTKGAVVAGGTAFVGGLLGGPPGIALGGALGGLLGSWLTSGQFRPLPQILMELPPPQRQKLYDDIVEILGSLNWMDAAQLVALVMGNATLTEQVTAALLSYVTKELRAEVRYGD